MRTRRTHKFLSLGLVAAFLASIAWGCTPATREPVPETGQASPLPPAQATSQPAQPLGPVTVTGPAEARDTALAYLAELDEEAAPPTGLEWTEASTTPAGLVGAEGKEYSAGDWLVSVAYPVTSLEQVIYAVAVTNRATGSKWEADVDAYGDVTELSPAESGVEPTRLPVPGISTGTADLETLVKGNNAFALGLYQALRSQPGNLFLSPYSISAALAMTYAGARGDTETQMAKALHFDLPQADLHPSFQALAQELAKRGQGAQGMDGQGFRLNIVNALWGQEGYSFLDTYLRLLSDYYGAGMERVDYSQPERARALINEWVSEQTEERIKDLIPEGGVNELTRLVLTNAIYFNAAWAAQFDENATADGPFARPDGSSVTAQMMSQTESFSYAEGAGYQAVELPYDGRELSMVILLPEDMEAFAGSLDGTTLEELLAALAPQQVALTMPKFEFDAQFSLAETLADMGMPLAFTTDADFAGMTSQRELFISDVFHKAFVKVDEAGTEAAAATAVVVGLTSFNPAEPVVMKVDRPFLFLIRDQQTGSILFLGRVIDPAA